MKPTRFKTTSQSLSEAHDFWNGDTKKRNDQAHYLGCGRWDEGKWSRHGRYYFRLYKEFLKEFSHIDPGPSKRMLDWGCGGGANAVSFSKSFEHVTGVDISMESIRICGDACYEKVKRDFFRPFLIPVDFIPKDIELLSSEDLYDFVLCTQVIQHMPSADYVGAVMSVWSSLCRKGANAVVQFRTHYNSRRIQRSSKISYTENVAHWVMLNPAVFEKMANEAGWEIIARRGLGERQRTNGYVEVYMRKI